MTVRSVIVNCPAPHFDKGTPCMNAALLPTRKPCPLACFAGIWTNWTLVRKVKEGETTNDLYAFLTTEPNVEVGAIHPKATPVILATPEEVETWMIASPDEALKLQ